MSAWLQAVLHLHRLPAAGLISSLQLCDSCPLVVHLQIMPGLKNLWRKQVAEGYANHDEILSKEDWGAFPDFKVLKQLHADEFNRAASVYSILDRIKDDVTEEQIMAALKYLLLDVGDSRWVAFLLWIRATADRSGMGVDRRLIDACLEVSTAAYSGSACNSSHSACNQTRALGLPTARLSTA